MWAFISWLLVVVSVYRADLAISLPLLPFFADCGCGDVHSFIHRSFLSDMCGWYGLSLLSILFYSVLFGALVDLA